MTAAMADDLTQTIDALPLGRRLWEGRPDSMLEGRNL
jgi:hypothetical protein